MRFYIALLIGTTVAVSFAHADWTTNAHHTLCYWYVQNVDSTLKEADTVNLWTLVSDHGDLSISEWNVSGRKQPAEQELNALSPAATSWYREYNLREEARIESLPLKLRAVIRAVCQVFNERLPVNERVTEVELEAAIQRELTLEEGE